jgi:hypothetical protein
VNRGYTKVIRNPKGGTLHVPFQDNSLIVHVTQKLTGIVKGKLIVETRKAEVIGPVDQIIKFSVGDLLTGNIYVKESHTPVDYDDHELYLAINPDGTYEKVGDNYVWRYTMYSEDPDETDQIVTSRFTAKT